MILWIQVKILHQLQKQTLTTTKFNKKDLNNMLFANILLFIFPSKKCITVTWEAKQDLQVYVERKCWNQNNSQP